MRYVVLAEDSPTVQHLAGIYDVADDATAVKHAAMDVPTSDRFYVRAFDDFSQADVTGRDTVVDMTIQRT